MNFSDFIPVWDTLKKAEQEALTNASVKKNFKKGEFLHNGSVTCTGLIVVLKGRLRTFSISSDGREITLYRLFPNDICLFSAECIMEHLTVDVTITADTDSEVLIISPEVYKKIMEVSAPLSNFTNQIMSRRISEVMWLVDQIMWKSFDKRLAEFLINEAKVQNSDILKITHEEIGNHLGNPREVVTRMLKYFANEGLVALSRGKIEILTAEGLKNLITR